VCICAAVILAGSLSVYSTLVADLEESACVNPNNYEDAKIWLQVLLIALCVFVSGAVFSFSSLLIM